MTPVASVPRSRDPHTRQPHYQTAFVQTSFEIDTHHVCGDTAWSSRLTAFEVSVAQIYVIRTDAPRGWTDEIMSATNQIQRKPSGRNPLRTVWRETYEVWDGVCHGVGKAYSKITGKW
ncbi:hypothetical protein QIS74_06538 [Colletotrichum tabaci]|uniref:Uncharacterized protein n=1 Tax=Colletotrichum tabaci TaxID=1209068 RepID=A0AAV9TD66_9PEZI